ncbi:MAG: FtsW/RodA/SpoVE family cell cycle protein, partial [Sphingobium sp.]
MSVVPYQIARLPWKLMALLTAIAGFGTIVLYSAAGGSISPWALNQAIRFVIFTGMAIGLSRLSVGTFARAALPTYVLLLGMLLFVGLVGRVAGGSQRWINLGFMQLQPSEFMKPTIVLAVAQFYARLPVGQIRRWIAIWPALVMIGVPWALVLVQPDLGTATMIAAGGVTIMFLAGVPLRLFIGAGLAGTAIIPIAFSFLHDYQQKRVLIFMDP